MDQWNLVIDVAQCNNCNNCVLAAKDEHVGNDFPGYSAPHPKQGQGVIRIHRTVRGSTPMVDAAYLPTLCNHCDNAPCLKAGGGDGTVRKRPDGIVIIDPVKAKGRRDLVDSCPYGAVVWNEVEQLPQHWIFDAHLLDQGWTAPRAVQACPTGALRSYKHSAQAMAALVQQEGLRPLKPELGTKPRIYYKYLQRIDHVFIGASLVAKVGDRVDCVADAIIELSQTGKTLAQTRSDTFGEFKFDGLVPNSGAFEVNILHPEHGRLTHLAKLGETSLYLGEILLNASSCDAAPGAPCQLSSASG